MEEYGIQIIDNRCLTCGNLWTESQILKKVGIGVSYIANDSTTRALVTQRPDLIQILITTSEPCEHPLCFRCVPITELKQGWQTSSEAAGIKKKLISTPPKIDLLKLWD